MNNGALYGDEPIGNIDVRFPEKCSPLRAEYCRPLQGMNRIKIAVEKTSLDVPLLAAFINYTPAHYSVP